MLMLRSHASAAFAAAAAAAMRYVAARHEACAYVSMLP